MEKDRYYSRLSRIPGVRPMPSIGDWILLEVEQPSELAKRLNRHFEPSPMSVPRHLRGAVRLAVLDPKTNEKVLDRLKEIVA